MQRFLYFAFFVLSVLGCKNPEECQVDFAQDVSQAEVAFERSDSAAFVGIVEHASEAFACSKISDLNANIQEAYNEKWMRLQRLNEAVPCRMFVDRLEESLERLEKAKDSAQEVWDAEVADWESVGNDVPTASNWRAKCIPEDLTRYDELVVTGNALIGYRTADAWIEQVEQGIEQVRGFLEGGANRLKEMFEE